MLPCQSTTVPKISKAKTLTLSGEKEGVCMGLFFHVAPLALSPKGQTKGANAFTVGSD
jgi:hypothetical protein